MKDDQRRPPSSHTDQAIAGPGTRGAGTHPPPVGAAAAPPGKPAPRGLLLPMSARGGRGCGEPLGSTQGCGWLLVSLLLPATG
ncbi:hypothetical protein Pmani_033556 [Petrolisthes manimaculis]|uniref:Uncharacterized protein n=1 Tax=Petrolisthes manimaculis TaxID=1843537 RepID=A0AAE1NRB7_9EUCA|nr:hypothetical protein Pmani_033556 [Petrolisthes manimaculis]